MSVGVRDDVASVVLQNRYRHVSVLKGFHGTANLKLNMSTDWFTFVLVGVRDDGVASIVLQSR